MMQKVDCVIRILSHPGKAGHKEPKTRPKSTKNKYKINSVPLHSIIISNYPF